MCPFVPSAFPPLLPPPGNLIPLPYTKTKKKKHIDTTQLKTKREQETPAAGRFFKRNACERERGRDGNYLPPPPPPLLARSISSPRPPRARAALLVKQDKSKKNAHPNNAKNNTFLRTRQQPSHSFRQALNKTPSFDPLPSSFMGSNTALLEQHHHHPPWRRFFFFFSSRKKKEKSVPFPPPPPQKKHLPLQNSFRRDIFRSSHPNNAPTTHTRARERATAAAGRAGGRARVRGKERERRERDRIVSLSKRGKVASLLAPFLLRPFFSSSSPPRPPAYPLPPPPFSFLPLLETLSKTKQLLTKTPLER